MGLRNVRLRKDLVALGYRERRVASVLVVGQGPALVLAPWLEMMLVVEDMEGWDITCSGFDVRQNFFLFHMQAERVGGLGRAKRVCRQSTSARDMAVGSGRDHLIPPADGLARELGADCFLGVMPLNCPRSQSHHAIPVYIPFRLPCFHGVQS